MKELSVFIDESGDFGEVKEHQGLSQMQKKLNRQEAAQNSLTNMFILLFSFGMLFFMLWNFKSGNVTYDKMLLATLAMMGSFGPVVALSSLSNNLTQTLASGKRVLSLLEEEPQIAEINGKVLISGKNIKEINTADLRKMESYMTQETYLFHDSIENNIAIGKPGAFREDKTVLLVSHRKSTMNLADKVYEMENPHIWIK